MTDPTPYFHLPGTTREALTFYGDVFDCEVQLHTFTEFNRNDGPADAIAHGYLAGGPVALFAADVSGDDQPFRCEGMMLSLLGTAEPSTLRDWFSSLADGGQVVDDLQKRPWGASDGQVIDRYGVHWLIGFEGDEEDRSRCRGSLPPARAHDSDPACWPAGDFDFDFEPSSDSYRRLSPTVGEGITAPTKTQVGPSVTKRSSCLRARLLTA